MVIYPQRCIGRTRRRLPLTGSFGARLRTVIGTPHLRSLAPPAALCGRSPRRLTECPSSLSNDVADTLLLCGAKVNRQYHQDMPRGKGTGCTIVRLGQKTRISDAYDKASARKHGKTRKKALTMGERCGNLTKLSARRALIGKPRVKEKSRKRRKK